MGRLGTINKKLEYEYVKKWKKPLNKRVVIQGLKEKEMNQLLIDSVKTGDSLIVSFVKRYTNYDINVVAIEKVTVSSNFLAHGPSKAKIACKLDDIRHGKIKPILVNNENMIIDGYATYLALKQLGEEYIPIVVNSDKNNRQTPGKLRLTELMKQYDGKCYICGRALTIYDPLGTGLNATLDHIIPVSKGGTNDPSNQALCCSLCNGLKSNFTYSEELKAVIINELKERGLL